MVSHVNSVIKGGPSEKVGLMPGDQIIRVNDTLFVGKKVTNDVAMSKLKGKKGTEVKLTIKRFGEKKLLSYTIVRGDIPVTSIYAAYMEQKKKI